MDILRFELPYPPSINHYYVHTATGVILGAKGKSYRRDAALLLHRYRDSCGGERRLTLTINVFPPDKRKRDIDNICKATLDALQYARVFEDDSQIDMLTVVRREVVKDGCLAIWIGECS
jgi:crossover junction endodeoxyribonuclease RusA